MRNRIIAIMFMTSMLCFGQTTPNKALMTNVEKVHRVTTVGELETLYQNFLQLTTKLNPDTHWMAYYYAGVSAYQQALLLKKQNPNTDVNSFLALAYKNAVSAKYNQQNAETLALVGLIELATLENGNSFIRNNESSIFQHMEKALTLEPNNLRGLILKAKLAIKNPSTSREEKAQIKKDLIQAKNKNIPTKANMPFWGTNEIESLIVQL